MDADNRLSFACACGTIAGTIHPATPNQGDHVVCHCTDCQALPAFLGATERILDDAGGTALYQSRCARLEFARGSERLACLHLTDKPTLRWYAMCCDTPMFNTYATGRIPYVTTILANCEAAGRDRLGPPLGHLFLEDAPVDDHADAAFSGADDKGLRVGRSPPQSAVRSQDPATNRQAAAAHTRTALRALVA